MSGHARLARDVNLDEEAELRRLEDGADDATALYCEARCTHTPQPPLGEFKAGILGTLKLYADRLEWTPDTAGERALEIDVGFVDKVQSSKAGSPNAKMLVQIKKALQKNSALMVASLQLQFSHFVSKSVHRIQHIYI